MTYLNTARNRYFKAHPQNKYHLKKIWKKISSKVFGSSTTKENFLDKEKDVQSDKNRSEILRGNLRY